MHTQQAFRKQNETNTTSTSTTTSTTTTATTTSTTNNSTFSTSNIKPENEIPEATKKMIETGGFLYGRTKYILNYALEAWYSHLEKYTAETIFIPLSLEEVNALHESCTKYYQSQAKKAYISTQSSSQSSSQSSQQLSLSKEDQDIIQRTCAKIDVALEKFGGKGFAKLSTRSPKDAIDDPSADNKFQQILTQELSKNNSGGGNYVDNPTNRNADLVAFSRANRAFMCVTSGAQTIEIFSKSSRIREDLARILEFPSAFSLNIIIRKWVPMDPGHEFRVFIFKRNVTAASQYCYLAHFPELLNNKNEIQNKILSFFGNNKTSGGSGFMDVFPYENAIVDVVVNGDNVQIIEINPFFGDTSACLFSWKEPTDTEIIKNGPFQLRLRQNLLENPYDALPTEWTDWICNFRGFARITKARKTQKQEQKAQHQESSELWRWVGIAVVIVGVVGAVVFQLRK